MGGSSPFLKTETYTYDDLGRLLTAQRGPNTNIQRKYSYDYDRWGNRWAQTVTAGTGLGGTLNFDTTNKNNRITTSGFSYAEGSVTAGNLTASGSSTSFTYNQENFLTVSSATYGTPSYTVDAQGRCAIAPNVVRPGKTAARLGDRVERFQPVQLVVGVGRAALGNQLQFVEPGSWARGVGQIKPPEPMRTHVGPRLHVPPRLTGNETGGRSRPVQIVIGKLNAVIAVVVRTCC